MRRPVERWEMTASDLDRSVAVTRAAFGDGVHIHPPERGTAGVALRTLRTTDLLAIRWRMSGAGRGSRDQQADDRPMVLTGLVMGGGLRLRTDDDEDVDTSRPFVYPTFVSSEVDAPDLANLAVPVHVVDERARAMTGDDRFEVRFTGSAPITPALDRVWRDTMVYADRTLAALAEAEEADLAHMGLTDLVVSQLLHVFPNTALEIEHERARGIGTTHSSVRRALRFIDDNLDKPFSVAELADASGLSLRGLHAAFLREMDTTPMRFVRDRRLTAAHEQLLEEDGGADVDRIALRWGFPSPGAFNRLHRSVYARPPGSS